MRRIPWIVLALAASVLSLMHATYAAHQQIPVVRLVSEAQIAAPPAAVWASMTTGKNLVTWCPVWKSPSNARIAITKVGDVLDFTDEYGNGGRSVVTYLEKNKELRVSHEPSNGSYLCQAKLILMAQGGGTKR